MKAELDEILNETTIILNNEFLVTPILYASFGLEKVIEKSFNAHDIDLLIPKALLIKKKELVDTFTKHDFQHIETEVLTFRKRGIEVEFAEKEKWFSICGFEANGILGISKNNGQYMILDANNLLKLYRFLSKLSNRNETKRKNDLAKIKELETYLNI